MIPVSDQACVKVQYQDAANLNARIQLHERFNTNQYDWHRWVFDHFDLPADDGSFEAVVANHMLYHAICITKSSGLFVARRE